MTKEELIPIIEASGLTEKQNSLWRELLEHASLSGLQDLFDFIEHEPTAIRILTDNMEMKDKALKNTDISEYEDVLRTDAFIVQSL